MNKKITLIALIISLVALVALACFTFFNANTKNETITSLEQQISELTGKPVSTEKNEKEPEKEIVSDKQYSDTDVITNLAVNLNNISNPNDTLNYSYHPQANGTYLSASENQQTGEITVKLYSQKYDTETKTLSRENIANLALTCINKDDIQSMYVFRVSTDMDNLFFLMKDGTVKYLTMNDVRNNVDQLREIDGNKYAKLDMLGIVPKQGPSGGGSQVIGIRPDGTIDCLQYDSQ